MICGIRDSLSLVCIIQIRRRLVKLRGASGRPRSLPGQDEAVCVGAAYGRAACGAALAQRDRRDGYDLRYIFIDPSARLCGLDNVRGAGLFPRDLNRLEP